MRRLQFLLTRPEITEAGDLKTILGDARANAWPGDPLQFCHDVFLDAPRDFQPGMLQDVLENDRVAYKAAFETGKSTGAAYTALWFLITHPGAMVITTASGWRQVKKSLWVEIRRLWRRSVLPRLSGLAGWRVLSTEIATDRAEWRAFGVAADSPKGVEGPHGHPVFIVIDEAAYVDREFYNSLEASHADSKILAISKPWLPLGWFYECFALRSNVWKCKTITAYDIPRLVGRAEKEKERLGENNPLYRQQQLAEFAGIDSSSLIPYDRVVASINRGIKKGDGWLRVLGVDVSGAGRDETVVTDRWGPIVNEQVCWSGLDPMVTVDKIAEIYRLVKPDKIIVDSGGMGEVVVSALRRIGVPAIKFNGGARAKRDQDYENLKTEIAYELLERFQREDIALPPDADKLMSQLVAWGVTPSQRGKNKLVDPDDSPDRADSLLIAFAAEHVGRPEYASVAR